LEVHLDKIAEELNLDPAEMRKRHLVKPYSVTANYLRIGSMGLRACIDKVVEGSDWKNKFSGWNVSEPRAGRGPQAGSPLGVVDATGSFDFRLRNSDLRSNESANPQSAIRNPQSTDPLATARGCETAHGPDDRKLPYGKGIGFAFYSFFICVGLPINWNQLPQSCVLL